MDSFDEDSFDADDLSGGEDDEVEVEGGGDLFHWDDDVGRERGREGSLEASLDVDLGTERTHDAALPLPAPPPREAKTRNRELENLLGWTVKDHREEARTHAGESRGGAGPVRADSATVTVRPARAAAPKGSLRKLSIGVTANPKGVCKWCAVRAVRLGTENLNISITKFPAGTTKAEVAVQGDLLFIKTLTKHGETMQQVGNR